MTEELSQLIVELKRDEVARVVKSRLEKYDDPIRILDEFEELLAAKGIMVPSDD